MARRIRAREVLRLRSVNGLSQNAIARTAHVSKHSVQDVLEAARERGVSWEDVEGMSEEAAYALLFPGRGDAGPVHADPDWARVHRELARTGVTLKLLHAEYADGCAEAGAPSMSYDRFCKRYRQYTVSRNVVSRVGHKAGRNMEVDWSGPTMRLVDVAQGPQEAAGHTQVDRARRLQREGRGGEQQDQGGNQAGLRLSEHRQPDRPHHVKVLGPEAGPAGAGGVGFYPHELTKPLFKGGSDYLQRKQLRD